MAALCPGVQYGLSSQQNFGENKDLIFVKLTDSALRAIDEYIKNQNKFSHNPTIKFTGNDNGELSFPSLHDNTAGGAGSGHGATHFRFTMSSTADMEGQGGSFECIKQQPRGPLEGLGSIPRKIRVHANDDSFGATKHRMAEAEDKYKNKCTREIKPNQTDIGRKVKVKQSNRPLNYNNMRKDVPPQVPSMRDALLKNSTPYPSSQPPIKSHQPQPIMHSSASNNGLNHHLSNGLGSNHVSSSRPQPSKKPSQPEIAKRPLKERLIHLLAIKPFKKLELHERLNKEGLREKSSFTTVLRQVATYKDNCYHLNSSLWNEVNEEWPFYTESEKQILKRRKPQNLTPPGGSSDGGSSGSGQSPTSTHPGSPPPPVSSTQGNKRHGSRENPDGFPYKKQRIAHSNRPPTSANSQPPPISTTQQNYTAVDQPYKLPVETNSLRRPVTDSRDASNMNPRSRESPTSGYFPVINGGVHGYSSNGHITSMSSSTSLNDKRSRLSEDDDDDDNEDVAPKTITKKRSCDSLNFSTAQREKSAFLDGTSGSCSPLSPVNSINKSTKDHYPSTTDRYGSSGGTTVVNNNCRNRQLDDRDRNSDEKYNKERIARVSPDSQTDSISNVDLDLKMEDEFPDYHKQYVTIQDPDQRRRYKTDFNADYAEYRDLHGIVEKVSKRFAQLEERLKQENENSPKYKDIKKQIVREYQENKKDLEHQRAKRRFQYLHDKLSHIKQLVLEYDQSVTADGRY